MALLSLVYRDQLFPRDAYRRTFDALLLRLPERQACRVMTDLLALAHERGCESELADKLSHFAPDPAALPNVEIHLAPLNVYEALIGADLTLGGAA